MPPKPPLTHFLCIPLTIPSSRAQIVTALSTLRGDITSPDPLLASSFSALPPDAVRPPGSLHLTLGVMSFARDDEALNRAVELLRNLKPREMLAEAEAAARAVTRAAAGLTAVGGASTVPLSTTTSTTNSGGDGTFAISLRGLRAMGSPTQTGVLYAPPVDALGILQRFCESVRAVFSAAELIVPETRPLLLHATMVNTVYIKSQGGRGHGRRPKRVEFDASALLDRYEDRVWVEGLALDRLAICRMGAKTVVGEDGEHDAEYEVEAEIEF